MWEKLVYIIVLPVSLGFCHSFDLLCYSPPSLPPPRLGQFSALSVLCVYSTWGGDINTSLHLKIYRKSCCGTMGYWSSLSVWRCAGSIPGPSQWVKDPGLLQLCARDWTAVWVWSLAQELLHPTGVDKKKEIKIEINSISRLEPSVINCCSIPNVTLTVI